MWLAGAGVAMLAVGVAVGWGLGLMSERRNEAPQAAAEKGYTAGETSALERKLKAAQAAADHQDASLYVPDEPRVRPPAQAVEPVRLPLWDSRAIDERYDPRRPPKDDGGAGVRPTDPPATTEPAGVPAWLRNAVVPPPIEGRPMVAIVIDDMGIDRRRTRRVIDLPGPLTTSFLSYAPDVAAQASAARRAGKELLVHMPMEPTSAAVDPGPDALTTNMQPSLVKTRFAASLERFDGYVGVNNHMGSKFTADGSRLRPVLETLRERGLLWLDSRTTAETTGPRLAREMGVPFAERSVFLDHHNTLNGVFGQLAKLEEAARTHGYAVAIGHPKDHTIEALSRWLPTLHDKGLVLVPLSTVVRVRQGVADASTRAVREQAER